MTTDKKNKDKDAGFVPMGTKISPPMAEVWNAVCEALGTDTYHMLQQFIYSTIRAACDQHALTPEIRQLIDLLEVDVGWQQAINLCAPNGRLSIAQMILIVEQEDKKGFGAVMIDRPFMGNATQTENTDSIYERLTEVIYKRTYSKLRRLGIDMGVRSVHQLLEVMIDEQATINLDRENAAEMQGEGDYTDYGRKIAYGKKTKSIHRRTPDGEAQRQQRIVFTEEDKTVTDMPDGQRQEKPVDVCEDFRPFGGEW